MSEVETDFILIYKLTRLLNMSAEDFTKRRLEKVRRRMVAGNGSAPVCVY